MPVTPEKLNLMQDYAEEAINAVETNMITMIQNFVFSDNGSGILRYKLNNLYRNNLTKVEIGYTESSSILAEPDYTEVNNFDYVINTGLTGTTIYIWIKLTYSTLGEIIINSNNAGDRYSVYMNEGGVACFDGSTKVLTEYGLTPIQNIKIGDMIQTSRGFSAVTKLYSHTVEKTYNIRVKDEIIKASYSHPFITNRGIIIAKNLLIGDILTNIDGKEYKIESIEIEKNPNIVYEINTDTNDYYITDKCIKVASEMLEVCDTSEVIT